MFKEFTKNFGDVMLIDETGTSLGYRTANEAKEIALEKGLKLIEVNTQAKPIIVKLVDIGKHKYDQNKNKRKPVVVEIKTMQLTVGTAENDLNVKAAKTNKWLEEGMKVFIKLSLIGRQAAKPQLGIDQLKEFLSKITVKYTEDTKMQVSGNNVTMTIKPEILEKINRNVF
jgi:translation initiation factor IF-3